MDKTLRDNKMGTLPVGKLLLTMSLPAIFSMLIQALYNIVDSIFVAQVSPESLSAVTIAFPMQMIVTAVALGVGVGTNAMVSRKLGEGRRDEADQYAQTGLMLALCSCALFIILGSFVPRLFMQAFSQNDKVINLGTDYLMICMICSFGTMIEITVSRTLQATGNMIIPMISQLIGAVTNIILDPIFIFVFKLDVAGAGIATVIGQISSMVFVVFMASRRSHQIRIFFHRFRPRAIKIWQIVVLGAPVMFVNAVGGFITMIMNAILNTISEAAVTVLGIYFKVQSFVFMPVFGLNQGALPIMSYNYGANNHKRYRQTFTLSIITAIVIMVIGTLIFQLAPSLIMRMFNADESTMTMGVTALRTISLCFLPAAFGIVVSNAYQAIGYSFTSLIMSMLRQLGLLIPAALIFKQIWGLNGIWWSYPFAELVTCLIFTPLFFILSNRAFKKRAAMLPEQETVSDKVQELFRDSDDNIRD